MSDAQYDAIILQLSKLLVSKQVDSTAVSISLELICESFDLDSGLLYEIDQYNNMNLKEHTSVQSTNICESFSIEDIDGQYRDYLSKEILCYITDEKDSNNSAKLLLSLFSAKSLLVSTLVDENMRINGLIIFINKNPRTLPAQALQTMSIAMTLLLHYISVRVYQNKLIFAQVSLESILDNTGIDIYVNDFNTHDILYTNKSMAAPYGGVSAFIGHKCWEVLFPAQNGPCEFCPQKTLLMNMVTLTRFILGIINEPLTGHGFVYSVPPSDGLTDGSPMSLAVLTLLTISVMKS